MSDSALHIFWMAFLGLTTAMLALTVLMYSEHQRSLRAARLKRANGSEKARRGGDAPQAAGFGGAITGKLRHVVVLIGERLAVVLGGESRETAANLSSAGFRSRDALLIYAFLKTVLPMAALIGGLIWLVVTRPLDLQIIMPAAIVIGAALGLSMGVDFVVNKARTARLARIRLSFPDMLELIVITSEAGLGPQPALHRVAQEMAVTHPELAQEMLQMVSEMAMTSDARGAYEKLNTRAPLPEIAVFTQTLDQSDRYGTPFARAMRTLINEQRSNRLVAVEEKAARLPVLMTMPLIFCIMPAVFVVLVGPAALSVLDNILSGG
ncbi:type II secretion system F family protein [Sulfitobacter sp. M57]|uniref:type II secretion system F family protein n=1 Tax=unclassified Sulfitobacter TaxID=196795 RepID=UPI0023E0A676|nr:MULTISPECIES: type II secretion system F family protein [unclassified Sulfitobacter]MDF3413763.1 type II secretion system F family protein [Sulfitobacter sp. KE5]MDF3420956.1 type II secretion system F family protein [Sulfitobacter sp. KE43]MDF3432309.1 type II secretion system F family protein [Sulfitobacter sp. KE42]MDF3457948.1 type II secretion system F family protein [Sulfitobacter sp. S74]MDF3461849.1 type II secretion system F family protein [Sulfitobacter sp. Ks18]